MSNLPPILQIENLSRQFGGLNAVSDVSLAFAAGKTYCIIGPNGAGKSTLLNMICGTVAPSSGRIVFDGSPVTGLNRTALARRGIARKFQIPSVFPSLTVRENLELAASRAFSREPRYDVDEMLNRIALTADSKKLAGHLAHGQKQWLEIGMAIVSGPRLLLLDEPTAGMTPDETMQTAELIASLQGHLTVVAIEHDIAFVRALACQTIVLHQGRVIASGPFEAIAEDDTVRDVYLGRS